MFAPNFVYAVPLTVTWVPTIASGEPASVAGSVSVLETIRYRPSSRPEKTTLSLSLATVWDGSTAVLPSSLPARLWTNDSMVVEAFGSVAGVLV